MPDKSWKAMERTIARIFGGRRRGPDYRGPRGGKTDVIAEGWAIECKLLARPTFGQMLDAAIQAETNAGPGELPIAIIKKKGQAFTKALVVMRLPTYRDWHIGHATPPGTPSR